MAVYKILFVESEDTLRRILSGLMGSGFETRTCGDGDTALELLHSFRPDVLVISLELPGVDGISVLKAAADAGLHPSVLATADFISDYIRSQVVTLGISYLMLKPYDLSALAARVRDLANTSDSVLMPQSKSQIIVTAMLRDLSIPTNLDGYQQIKTAVPLLTRDFRQLFGKELYPQVASLCGCGNAQQVERSIREAIKSGWKQRDTETWSRYFPPNMLKNGQCPSNRPFLLRLAEILTLESE